MERVATVADFADFRREARSLLAANVRPEHVAWSAERQSSLFQGPAAMPSGEPIRIPRRLVQLLEEAACHCDPLRWSLLYRLLWRATRGGEPHLLDNPADPDVRAVQQLAHAVAHEVHKMHAFVRFRRANDGPDVQYVAWFEPRHHILRRAAPFFADRFAAMRWAIVTPAEAACWDGAKLVFSPGPHSRPDVPADDAEPLWRTYYASVFNPARLNTRLMTKEVPRRYWHNLPEMRDVGTLAHEAQQRVATMQERRTTVPRWSQRVQLPAAAEPQGLHACRRCPLWRRATQPVAGEGPANAAVMVVGEQPGDEEDLQGKPFVGPAGKVLAEALAQAGLARERVYVTNAVKHFKWEPRGKRRLHKTPAQREVEACRPWLEIEIERNRPRVIVALGATAARALTGRDFGIAQSRGMQMQAHGANLIVTYHPSAVLRAADGARHFEALREDLAAAARVLTEEAAADSLVRRQL